MIMEQTLLRDVTNRECNMEKEKEKEKEDEVELQADIEIWRYMLGFTEMAVVKCAIHLGIADFIHNNGGSMSLIELASCVKCPPSSLERIMTFLTHRNIFSQTQTSQESTTLVYTQTPLSRRLVSEGEQTMVPVILLESSPVMLAPWLGLSNRVQEKTESAFDDVNGQDLWKYTSNNIAHGKLFNDAMACIARVVVPKVIKECPNLFDGVGSVVDVGGGNGTALSMIVKAFPWIQGFNFDLPHVVSQDGVVSDARVQHIGGDMFDSIPKADVVFIMNVLHDWGDEECIKILKKCKEAIPKDKGKVIIVEVVIKEDPTDKYENIRLMIDMVMLAHTTNGKERTLKGWNHLFNEAGFSSFNIKLIPAYPSVIEAFP